MRQPSFLWLDLTGTGGMVPPTLDPHLSPPLALHPVEYILMQVYFGKYPDTNIDPTETIYM